MMIGFNANAQLDLESLSKNVYDLEEINRQKVINNRYLQLDEEFKIVKNLINTMVDLLKSSKSSDDLRITDTYGRLSFYYKPENTSHWVLGTIINSNTIKFSRFFSSHKYIYNITEKKLIINNSIYKEVSKTYYL